jgi:hypothetical protein
VAERECSSHRALSTEGLVRNLNIPIRKGGREVLCMFLGVVHLAYDNIFLKDYPLKIL